MAGPPCAFCRGPMPPRKGNGRPPAYCSSRCRKAAERERRREERRESERLAELARLAQLAAERQAAAVALVQVITEDPQGAVTALDRNCHRLRTWELEQLRQEIEASLRCARRRQVRSA